MHLHAAIEAAFGFLHAPIFFLRHQVFQQNLV